MGYFAQSTLREGRMSGRRVARHRLGGCFLVGRLAGAQAVKLDHRFPRHRLDEEIQFDDRYDAALLELANAKMEGRKITRPKALEPIKPSDDDQGGRSSHLSWDDRHRGYGRHIGDVGQLRARQELEGLDGLILFSSKVKSSGCGVGR
jgi:hypothetical protein